MQPALSPRVLKKARPGLAAFCLGVFLGVYAMAAIPALHTLVHDDASDPAHQCAVTLLSQGQVHCASVTVECGQPAPIFAPTAPASTRIFVSTDVRLLPVRGPPAGPLFA
jgi:hypothetical protein